jgi:UDP-3-O-[3-hydroxymyristoyl] N-acetylglucosamine deacetylase
MGRRTIGRVIAVEGVGLHTGTTVRVELRPAAPDAGIGFVGPDGERVPALLERVVGTRLATTLGGDEKRTTTVEHLLAAVRGMGIDDIDVWVDGPEIPCLDGSAKVWLSHLADAGVVDHGGTRTTMVIRRPVRVSDGDRWLEVVPADTLRLELVIDFPHPSVGRQEIALDVDEQSFAAELAWARTFGFMKNVESLRRMGLIQGGNLDNAIVFGGDGVLNPGGLHRPDEPVRHKALDLLGDVALLGFPVRGCFRGERPGHSLVIDLLRALLADAEAWHLEADGASP